MVSNFLRSTARSVVAHQKKNQGALLPRKGTTKPSSQKWFREYSNASSRPISAYWSSNDHLSGTRYHHAVSRPPQAMINFAGHPQGTRTRTSPRRLSSSTKPPNHPLDPLSPAEIGIASSIVKRHVGLTPDNIVQSLRFVAVSLLEPPKKEYIAGNASPRRAEVITLNPTTGLAAEYVVNLDTELVDTINELPWGTQPMLTPEDCDLAEAIVKSSKEVQKVLLDRYGITDVAKEVACDPWSVHLASEEDRALVDWRKDEVSTSSSASDDSGDSATNKHIPGRLVQTFLYQRQYGDGLEDNHYAHPIDVLPVVDLNARTVVTIQGLERAPPKLPTTSVQYHRDLLSTNSYLPSAWREERLSALNITQPDGPSFTVDGNFVEWQKWSFRVGFNYREGLVLHDVMYDNRLVMNRASLVEMAVPYADPHPPFQRKCAFDVGDYGLGYCANSLELGCDCLGHIHYFDATLNNSQGDPVDMKKVICMHEEDAVCDLDRRLRPCSSLILPFCLVKRQRSIHNAFPYLLSYCRVFCGNMWNIAMDTMKLDEAGN